MSAIASHARTAFFSPALSLPAAGGRPSGLADSRLGEEVSGLDDIHQCIYIILSTPRGADPHRPTFGADIYRHIDAPTDFARPRIVRDAIEAIERWEPRVRVRAVTVEQSDEAQLLVTVQWVLAEDAQGQQFSTVLPYFMGDA